MIAPHGLFFFKLNLRAPPSPQGFLLGSSNGGRLRYSQKMLVMSESRLKIQITSGADIRTKDQETPLTDWWNFLAMAPRRPVQGPWGASSSSSGSWIKPRRSETVQPIINTNAASSPPSGFLAQCRCEQWIWGPRPSWWQEWTASVPPPTGATTGGVSGIPPEDKCQLSNQGVVWIDLQSEFTF